MRGDRGSRKRAQGAVSVSIGDEQGEVLERDPLYATTHSMLDTVDEKQGKTRLEVEFEVSTLTGLLSNCHLYYHDPH